MSLVIQIPWPPSANTYYRHVGHKILISKKGRAYQKAIQVQAMVEHWERFFRCRLSITILACPPDRRRRDLDNTQKVIFDSLQNAGIYDDDEQIDFFSIERKEVEKPGKVILKIERINP